MGTRHLILNVDDDEVQRYAKSRILGHAGFEIAEARTGREAIDQAERLQPSIVLLDVKLPDISGLRVCGTVKKRWPHIFVLQTSATYVTGADRTRGLEGGADGYLIQPIDPAELVAAVRSLLRLREVEEKLRHLNEILEQRVIERTQDLEQANAQLKEEMKQRKRAEAALVQGQKMEAIGLLTGGIAHDFNNLLTAVIGNLDRIRARARDAKTVRLAENAYLAAERGAKLTAQLLAFSRIQKLATQPVDVNALISGMHELLNHSLGPSVTLRYALQPDLRPANSDPNQLELAILNLAINSRDAMPEGRGEILIETSQHDGTDGPHPGGGFVTISVTDNGSGMTPETANRAFDPFFTTKPAGKGTGLGLSQVYGIAHQAGGTATLSSEPGVGTTVSICLPVSQAQTARGDSTPQSCAHPNTETILIVDDDADVRELVGDYLAEIGYRTHVAESGEEALRLLDELTPDLLVADFAMPGLNGAEVARTFRQRLPTVPVVFFSGYADSAALEEAVGSAPLLRKPFRPSELAQMIRSTLDHTAGPTPSGNGSA